MILACKQAEDGDGYILRLLELAGEQTTIRLRWPGISATGAYRTNIVEQDLEPLGISGHEARVTIPPFGIETLRFRMRAQD